LQKIGILDLSLVKLLQNEQGCNFLPHSVVQFALALPGADAPIERVFSLVNDMRNDAKILKFAAHN